MLTELGLFLVFTGMLTLPGWAALSLADNWRQWRGLQRWVVAVGISIAFYPVFFYGMRSVLPFLTLGPYKMSALLLGFAVIVGWRMRRHWREQFTFDQLEWTALAVFGMTLFTRFWIVRDHPYPAWSDSLHHVLLTQLTAVQGHLPFDMEPYFPVSVGQYHLGLYALSATVQWLAQVPAHTALLWTAQMLNGLCGAGVYLVLDRKVGRLGAVVGAAVAGLWSHQPGWYVNWGRFTQIASQTILLIAWLVMWETIVAWKRSWQERRAKLLWSAACAGMLIGAVFLLHFRVAIFCVPLLIISVTWEWWKGRKENQGSLVVLAVVVIGAATLIAVTPALWKAMRVHIGIGLTLARLSATEVAARQVPQAIQQYFEFPLDAVPILAARPWLIVVACLSAGIGLLRLNKLVIASLLWVVTLCFIGYAHILGLPVLAVTNLGAIMIMMYLPIGLIVGSAAEQAPALLWPHWRGRITQLAIALVLVVSFAASHVRVTEIELYRHFITPEDVAAMDWIRENTPADALFAVNTYFWLPRSPHGTDAGYWIPYFTGRQTTVGTMLAFVESSEYRENLVLMSRAVEQLEVDNTSLVELQAMGVDYVYIGKNGDFSGPGLSAAQLAQAENVKALYQRAGVTILEVKSLHGAN